MMAPRFDGVLGFHVVGRHAYSLEPRAAGCLQCPHLWLAFRVLDLQIDPGMRDDQMHFLDHTLNIHECFLVRAMRMVCATPATQRPPRKSPRDEDR